MTAPGTGWLTVAERGSLLGMYFVVWCSRIFGRRICAYLIVPVVGYFFVTGRAARRASRDYLARLYRWARREGHDAVPRAPGWRESFRHFHEFALNMIDRASFFLGDTGEFETVVHGREHLQRLAQRGRGALVVSAHLGSFDALRLVADQGGVALNVAMFLRNARMINTVFTRLNPSQRLRIIDLERAAPHSVFDIRACLQRGEFVGEAAAVPGTAQPLAMDADGHVAVVAVAGENGVGDDRIRGAYRLEPAHACRTCPSSASARRFPTLPSSLPVR